MAQYLATATAPEAKRADGKNAAIIVAADENAARDRLELMLNAQEGSLGTSTAGDGRGWVFATWSATDEFVMQEGSPIRSGGLDRGGSPSPEF